MEQRKVIGDVEHVWDGSKWVPSSKSQELRKSMLDSIKGFADKFKGKEAEASEPAPASNDTLGKRIGYPK